MSLTGLRHKIESFYVKLHFVLPILRNRLTKDDTVRVLESRARIGEFLNKSLDLCSSKTDRERLGSRNGTWPRLQKRRPNSRPRSTRLLRQGTKSLRATLSRCSPSFSAVRNVYMNTQNLWFKFRNFKIVYRRYAGLFFCFVVDPQDNELAVLEAIHLFVEVLDTFFKNVCELDLVFHFYKCYMILDEFCLAGELQETR